ncbi:GRIP and coiled-coil domain-containing protein 1 [Hemicordylus capensis]|uniref:GRIP and coiled-coil domain-containing protein 1 n=1 Tax=Hemicordylus capensis TaxID=884348 RepID=UPI002303B441|nr:GRIP and coiled-coil domain-containing protein 1 [Hemicordylus capensis]XP_053113072.1 GRIP and coiled-coil domain-containing protein 1 [Hemicordylus capensis]XP_053113073.1 GRIP and coiled-coil domain-containing protein 1 [Hemicordylus capensis]
MEKLGMSFGGSSSSGGPSKRALLLETVEVQKQQLQQYQVRLRDVVRAYKSLLAEKEALEASLKALSAWHQPAGSPPDPTTSSSSSNEDRSSVQSEDSLPGAAAATTPTTTREGDPTVGLEEQEEQQQREGAQRSPGPEEPGGSSESGFSSGSSGAEPPGSEADRCRVLQVQLATLTGALATVAQEKSRMEASYQADKKKLKQEMEEAGRKTEEERSHLEAELKDLRGQLAETKARLIAQQHDRAQEQSDHAVMLRELQRLLQSERGLRQEAELALEETREALAGKTCVAERVEGYERQARRLAEEVEQLKRELQAVQEESNRPDPQLQELQSEMASLKSHFQSQLQQEVRKTAQAEEHVQMEEQRVASLEAQISEVSELLGTYEKAKQKDQLTIQKLKDRVVQLDLENKTLAIAASGRSPMDVPIEESHLDVNVLKDKMEKLRGLLQVAAKHNRSPPDMEAFCTVELPKGMEMGDGEKATAAYYKQELKQLKEEFERYKLRAQVVLKNKSAKDGNLAKELEDTQEQLVELKEKYVSLRLSCEEAEKQHQEEREAKKQELSHLQQLHRQELERSQLDYREKVLQLEGEVHKQRDRALAMLADKDRELEQLRALALPRGLQGPKQGLGPASAAGGAAGGSGSHGLADEGSLESLTQALWLSSPSEPAFLLYTEQLARKEVEVSALKRQKHKLEAEVRQCQERLLEEGEKHREEVSALQGHIQKNFRDQSREGANLEYLKNIFYRFLTLPDLLGRQQTLTAMLTILHFSPEEKQAVLRHPGGGGGGSWWHSGKR